MATISKLKSVHTSLSTTTVDIVQLTQFWDGIEISNQGTTSIWCTFNGATPTASGDNEDIVEAGVTKLFPAALLVNGAVGSTTTPCHQVQIIGSGNAYSVMGVAGQ